MKVLVVTQYFWPESFRVNELINALYETGCEITVLTGQPNYPEGKIFTGYGSLSFKKQLHNGYRILRVPMISRGKSGSLRLLINYISFMLSASFFGPFMLRKQQFDAIFAVNQSPVLAVVPGIVLKKIKKIPLLTWIGDLWPQSLESTGHVKNKWVIARIEKLVQWIYRSNDMLLLQSATFDQPVKQLCGTVPVEYLPNPGEKMFSANAGFYKPALTLDTGFNIVYAGNIGTVQSVEMIVNAAAILQPHTNIRFVLVGSGSKTDWIKNQIEQRRLSNIQLPGRYPIESIPAILDQADALLVSLVKDPTMSLTVPAKTQSYLAAGRPIIAALDGEGARVVTEARAGVAVPAEDAQLLAEAILHLRDLPASEREKMGNAGKKYYQENYDSAVVARKLKMLIERVIAGR